MYTHTPTCDHKYLNRYSDFEIWQELKQAQYFSQTTTTILIYWSHQAGACQIEEYERERERETGNDSLPYKHFEVVNCMVARKCFVF